MPNSANPLLRVTLTISGGLVVCGALGLMNLFAGGLGGGGAAPAAPRAAARPGAAAPAATPDDDDAARRAAVDVVRAEALALAPPPSLAAAPAVAAPTPQWIWSSRTAGAGDRAVFRRTVTAAGTPRRAVLRVCADNHAIVRADGAELARGDDWATPIVVDLGDALADGAAAIEIEAWNDGGPAGVAVLGEIVGADGIAWIASDASWTVVAGAPAEPGEGERSAVAVASFGDAPWGAVPGLSPSVTARDIRVVPGFDVQLVAEARPQDGSWVSLAVDAQGRIVAGAQNGGLVRIEPAPLGAPPEATRIDAIDLPVRDIQGLAFVGRDLYAVVNGAGGDTGPGLYRLRDADGDDAFETLEQLFDIPHRGGEHGLHAIVPGPDGMLYMTAGNHVPLPPMARSRVPRVWDEDVLLPRMWDANGHAVGKLAPGGWIARTNADGRAWELLAIGLRNAYDIAFDDRGELFAWDADMEWDMGAPWYRPTRLYHATSGADFGWRSGTAKWPAHWPDGVPPVLDVGPASPTGMLTGRDTRFPAPWRDAMFLLDWTYGTIHAVTLAPDGATYRAERTPFLAGKPLPLTDAVVRPQDGALYFAVGGRRTASAIYRVVALDPVDPAAAPPVTPAPLPQEAQRRLALERFHVEELPASEAEAAVAAALPALDDDDRAVRYAARIALEHRDPALWGERALAASPRPRLGAAVALARVGGSPWRDRVAAALLDLDLARLGDDDRRDALRAWSLLLARTGAPSAAQAGQLRARLEALYPLADELANRDACDLLVFLGSPRVVARTVPLMEGAADAPPVEIDAELLSRSASYGEVVLRIASAPPQAQQVHYALSLRNARAGWTQDLRDRYFRWFDTARRTQGGLSFAGFLDAIRKDALAGLPEDVAARYRTDGPIGVTIDPEALPRGPGRAWTTETVVALASAPDAWSHRRFDRGQRLFEGAMCAACHRLAGAGGSAGPDLTGAGARFSLRDLVETIVEPSRVISDQYEQEEIELTDGTLVVGRVVADAGDAIQVRPSPLAPDVIETIPLERIASRRPSTVSPMMPNLLDTLNPGEVLDLLAYLRAGGDPRDPAFAPSGAGPWRELFDGASLAGWRGADGYWAVEDGAIVGRSTAAHPLPANSFLVRDEALPTDLEIRAEIMLSSDANNSGIQYRAKLGGGFAVKGPQCDVHPNTPYHGMLYEEGGRGIVVEQGARRRVGADGSSASTPLDAPPMPLVPGRWHEYQVIARGSTVEHRVDGVTTIVFTDDSGADARVRGDALAIQLHAGAPYEVRVRRIRVRALGGTD